MFVRAKRQVFAPDKPENHINEGKEKKKWKERGERKEGKKAAVVALLVFILATFLAENKTAWWKTSIIIPLFITFGDKNYGNITIKFKTLHIIYTYQIKLSLAPLGINDCLCLTVRDTGILRCAGLVSQDLRLWPWSTGLSKKRLQGCASDSRIRLNSFLVKFWRLVTSDSTVSLGKPKTFRHLLLSIWQ